MLRNVVFPDPDGPMTETNSPSLTVSDSPSSACVSTRSVRYTLRMLFICSMRSLLLWSAAAMPPLSLQNHRSCVPERRRIRRHHALPHLQPAQNFDFGNGRGADGEVPLRGGLAA